MRCVNPCIFLIMVFTGVGTSCNKTLVIDHYKNAQYIFSPAEYSAVDPALYNHLRPFRDSVERIMNKPLATSSESLVMNELSNFAADACLSIIEVHAADQQQLKVDFVVLNRGGLRASLPKGEITLRNIYELMPFENELVILKLEGNAVVRLCEDLIMRGEEPIAGIIVTKNPHEADLDILVRGIPLRKSKNYYVATSDYLANGGDEFEFAKPMEYHHTGIKVRDAMVKYLDDLNSDGEMLKPGYEHRIKK